MYIKPIHSNVSYQQAIYHKYDRRSPQSPSGYGPLDKYSSMVNEPSNNPCNCPTPILLVFVFLAQNCLVDKDFKDEYSQCREFLIGLDQDQSMGGLTQCHMPNGKVLWLCKEHSATDERISSMDNAGAVVDQSTSIDLSQSE